MAVAFCDTAHGLSEHSVGNTVDSEQFMTDGNASVGSYQFVVWDAVELKQAHQSLVIGVRYAQIHLSLQVFLYIFVVCRLRRLVLAGDEYQFDIGQCGY